MKRRLAAVVLSVAALAWSARRVGAGPVLLPWHEAAAGRRQVVRVSCPAARQGPVVQLALLKAPDGFRLRLVEADAPREALPVYRSDAGTVGVRVPGTVSPEQPRLLIAYWSRQRDWPASPFLDAPPEDTDDFANAAYDDAWDFDEGDQEGITSWGNRPTEYGDVQVRGGTLIVPVTGDDPYFIWGVMWGDPDDPRALHIDSATYRTLRLRVRQTCQRAGWSLFVTDSNGIYKRHQLEVSGTDWQELSFDLAELFAGFWDGREFRALRIDTTNDSPGTTVEIDWVKLMPVSATVGVGPVFSSADVERRNAVKSLRVDFPKTAQAGARLLARMEGLDGEGQPVAAAPLVIGFRDEEGTFAAQSRLNAADGATLASGTVGEHAGAFEWVVGLCDDLGQPAPPWKRFRLKVTPAALDHYELTPQRRLVLTSQPEARITLWGADRFGNHVPVDMASPNWQTTGGAVANSTPLRGAPATIAVTCSRTPLSEHTVILRDERGHTGTAKLMTMALKQRPITLTPTGYLADAGGKLFLPLGGFYANWPAGLPEAEGNLARSVDLFPCSAIPYPHGFPWSPDVEQKVRDYLDLCHRHGATALRLMLRNMDLVGRVDSVQLKAVLHLFDLARPLGIRFDVALFEDYNKPPYCNAEVLEKVVLPHYAEDELRDLPPHRARFLVEKRLLGNADLKYTDAEALACQRDYLVDLLPYLSDREEVFCYEFENEMVHPPVSWVNDMTAFIREIDPRTPILGNPGPHAWPEPWRWREAKCDLFSYHPYNDGTPKADHGAVVFMRSKWAAACGLPMSTGEGGINQNRWQQDVKKVPPEYAMRGIRDQVWLSLCCGANGAFMWTASHELEMAEFGKVAPALRAVGIDLLTMKRRRPRTALLMPKDASANAKAYALGWALLRLGVDFDTLPAAQVKDYGQVINAATADPQGLTATPELIRPSEGYQLAYLADENLDQVLVYLRNAGGGIVNLGNGRPCYLREPKRAQASVTLVDEATWREVRAYDLDAGREVLVVSGEGERVLRVRNATTNDFLLSLRR